MTLPVEFYEAQRMARAASRRDEAPDPTPPPTVEDAVRALLVTLGVEDDEHTHGTPARSAKAWAHRLNGYNEDPALHLRTTFGTTEPVPAGPWEFTQATGAPTGESLAGDLVLVGGIEVHSTCAHHLLPITGKATVAYVPTGGRVVGLSKLARVVDGYARRLQVQERLGSQVANALRDELGASSVACLITADHGCMRIRGVMQQATVTTTVATAGTTWDPATWGLVTGEHHRRT